MTRDSVTILGVPVDRVTLASAAERIAAMANGDTQHHVVTPNPEMLVAADRDPAFKAILCKSSLNIPDGVGLLWAARVRGAQIPRRVTGVDVLAAVCAPTCDIGPVFLLGAASGVAEKAAAALRGTNPALQIVGTFAGSPDENDEADIRARITASGAHVLFVAYGAPQQEQWIARNLPYLPSIRVAMGVGGSFDFLSSTRYRAPVWMQSIGLEWLYRLIQQPSRIKRIFTAVVIFPLLVLRGERG